MIASFSDPFPVTNRVKQDCTFYNVVQRDVSSMLTDAF